MYRKEAPWESAQKELLKINAYKVIMKLSSLFLAMKGIVEF